MRIGSMGNTFLHSWRRKLCSRHIRMYVQFGAHFFESSNSLGDPPLNVARAADLKRGPCSSFFQVEAEVICYSRLGFGDIIHRTCKRFKPKQHKFPVCSGLDTAVSPVLLWVDLGVNPERSGADSFLQW